MHELGEVQVARINRDLTHLKKRMLVEASILFGTLGAAIQTGGFTLPLAVLAGLQGYKSLNDYRKQKRDNPAFFLWKVTKNSSLPSSE